MNPTFQIEHTVSYSEVDSYYKLRLDHILSHFQHVADLHSKEMETDGETLRERSHVFWVLTKVKLKLAGLPRFGDPLRIETWPLKAKGARYDRDFSFSDRDRTLVMGASEWCTLDCTTGKLRRVDSVAYPQDLPFREDRSGAGEFRKMREEVSEAELHHVHRSSYVDIDTNQHTNNVAYLRMVLNCFSPQEFEELALDELQLSFLSQTFYGDEIRVYKKQTDYGYYIEGRTGENAVFRCVLVTRPTEE